MHYVESVKKQFNYYKMLGEKTFTQLEEKDFFWQFDGTSNSIAIIVNHLYGNMKSRWIDVFTSDGEKDWRNRDLEFEDVLKSKSEVLEKWELGWQCLFHALDTIEEENLNAQIYIRNHGHTLVEAINRQLCHYSYHIGQIVFIGRMKKGNKWISLSIPKGKSKDYNAMKFSKDKHKAHYTDEFLKENKSLESE